MRIVVIGPGAMGCLFAGRLVEHGRDVTLLDHFEDRAAELAANGLRIETLDGDEKRISCDVTVDPVCLEEAELAFVCVKAYDTAAVAGTLGKRLADNASVLTLQNGLGNVEALTGHVSADRVFGGTTAEGATLLGVGHVRHAGFGPTVVSPAADERMDESVRLAEFLSQNGFDATSEAGLLDVLWKKLVVNAAINPITALLGVLNGQVVEIPAARELLADVVREVAAVATADGVLGEDTDMVERVEKVARATAANSSSMLQDVTNRQRTEIDAILGAVMERAKKHGIPVPVCTTLFRAVKALDTT
jgi:2-dehydropantoate 2-reductase